MKNKKCPNCLCVVDPNAKACPYCKTSLKSNIDGFLPKIGFKTPEVTNKSIEPLHNTKFTGELPYLPPKEEKEEEEEKVNIGDFLEVDIDYLKLEESQETNKKIEKIENYIPKVISLNELPNLDDIEDNQALYLEEEKKTIIDKSNEFDFNSDLMNDIKAYFDLNDNPDKDYEKSHTFLMDKLSIDDIVQGSIQAEKREKKEESFGLMFGANDENNNDLPSYQDIVQTPKAFSQSLENNSDEYNSSLDDLGFSGDKVNDNDFKELKHKLSEPDPTIQSLSNNIIEHLPINIPLKIPRFKKNKIEKVNENNIFDKEALFSLLKIRTDLFFEEFNKEDPYYYLPFEIENLEISEIRDYEYKKDEYEFSKASEIDVNPDFLKELNDFAGVSEKVEEEIEIEEVKKEFNLPKTFESKNILRLSEEKIHDSNEKEKPTKLIRDAISELESLKLEFDDNNEIIDDEIFEELKDKESINTDSSDWFKNQENDIENTTDILDTNKPLFDIRDLKIDFEETTLSESTENEIEKGFVFETLNLNNIVNEEKASNNESSENNEYFESIGFGTLENSSNGILLDNFEDSDEFEIPQNIHFESLEGLKIPQIESLESLIDSNEKTIDTDDIFKIELPSFINLDLDTNDKIEVQEEEKPQVTNILIERLTSIESIEVETNEENEIEIPDFLQNIESISINQDNDKVEEPEIKIGIIPRLQTLEHETSNEELESLSIPNFVNQISENIEQKEELEKENVETDYLKQTFITSSQSQIIKEEIAQLNIEVKITKPKEEVIGEPVFKPISENTEINKIDMDKPVISAFQPEPLKMRNPITTTINTTLGARSTTNNEAMNLYLSARDLCLKKEYLKALDELEKSVKIDPAFEQAHILLSRTYLKTKNIY